MGHLAQPAFATRWTLLLSFVAFIGGMAAGLAILFGLISENKWVRRLAAGYIEVFQGTPLLLQLFLIFLVFLSSA